MKRKPLLITIISMIGIILCLSFFIKEPVSEMVNKSRFLLADTTAKMPGIHAKKKITLTPKSLLLPTYPASKNIDELEETIHTILDDDRLKGAIAGISVRHADSQSLVYSYQADTLLRPASNMKILTTVAALEVLGPDYQFTTEVSTDGTLKHGVLDGNLYLVGKGDPTLQTKDFDELAKELSKKDIKKIMGSIIADDSWYDDVRYSQDLNWSDEFNYTGAAISALTASPNDDHLSGSIIIDVFPAEKAGEKPEVRITPETDYVTVVNKAKTVDQNEVISLTAEREHGSNRLFIEGDIPVNSAQFHRWRSVWEPTGYALDLFKSSLKKQEITFDESGLKIGTAPKKAKTLVTKKSMPLKELINPFMKLSNNGIGEVLVKEMGQVIHNEGSWEKGLAVMEDTLHELGMNKDEVVLRDGSGMSHKNLVSPNHLTNMLINIQDKSWFSHFENSFPIAGDPNRLIGGTLVYRLAYDSTKDNVKAKTGSLTGVSTLSGYLTTKDGVKLAFSIMFNNYVKGPITDIEDQIVTVLAESELR